MAGLGVADRPRGSRLSGLKPGVMPIMTEEELSRFARALGSGTGRGVRVGIIDTGITDHPAFRGRVREHYRVVDRNRKVHIRRVRRVRDDLSHGTACADIILRHAPEVTLCDVQVMHFREHNSRHKLAAAIKFAALQGWDVLNICVGTQVDFDRLRDATRMALEAGMILLSATDNHEEHIGFPAAYPGVISVDLDYLDDPLDFRPGERSDLVGHGIYVEARNAAGALEAFTGSSFACPHIAALAARARETFPQMDSVSFGQSLHRVAAMRAGGAPCSGG